MHDRAMQILWKYALDPIAEVKTDRNSFGGRKFRSAEDANGALILSFGSGLRRKNWVLKADIKSFFDNILHTWLLENIPINRVVLKQFLKAGFFQPGQREPIHTEFGVPQGGVISPLISNLTLNGLEATVTKSVEHTARNNTKHSTRFRAGVEVFR